MRPATGGGALIGKRVCAVPAGAFGGYAEVAVAPVAMTFEMPVDMDTATAASVYMPFHVASLALYERAHLSADDTVLVHAAAGGAGSAAVQLARARGARVIATAGSPHKLNFATQLGADVAIDYRNDDFVARVLDATGGGASTWPSIPSVVRRRLKPFGAWRSEAAICSSASHRGSRLKTKASCRALCCSAIFARRRLPRVHRRCARIQTRDRIELPVAR